MAGLINWRRLALAAPVLLVAAVALYVLVLRDDASASTPRAALAETPPGIEDRVGVLRGDLAGDFVATAPDGAQLRLSELRGAPSIINFWASWCTSCLAELPDLQELQRELGVENLHVVAINAGEDSGTASEFIDKLGIDTFRVGMDPTLVVADAYGVFGLPTSVFVDADGVVRGTYAGQLTDDALNEFVAAVRAGSDAPEPDPRLRLITTVAREHVLEVSSADGTLELRSKRLRCDESYCSGAALDALADSEGVTSIERFSGEDPPRAVVRFDAGATNAQEIVDQFIGLLNEHPDPLYERPLEVRWY